MHGGDDVVLTATMAGRSVSVQWSWQATSTVTLTVAVGSLPPQWGQQGSLQKLVLLDVSKASLTGSLPAIWATQMPKLGGGVGNGLWFEDNQLTGEDSHASNAGRVRQAAAGS